MAFTVSVTFKNGTICEQTSDFEGCERHIGRAVSSLIRRGVSDYGPMSSVQVVTHASGTPRDQIDALLGFTPSVQS